MDYWKGIGYQPGTGKCSCKNCMEKAYLRYEDDEVSVTYIPQSPESSHVHLHPHRVVPPTKLGFYDSHIPYYSCHDGGGGRLPSGVKTFAEATETPKRTLNPTHPGGGSEGKEAQSPPGSRRVSEILSRLKYLSSKRGLRLHELIKSLKEDALKEKQDSEEDHAQMVIAQKTLMNEHFGDHLLMSEYPPLVSRRVNQEFRIASDHPLAFNLPEGDAPTAVDRDFMRPSFPTPTTHSLYTSPIDPNRAQYQQGRPLTYMNPRKWDDFYSDPDEESDVYSSNIPGNHQTRLFTSPKSF